MNLVDQVGNFGRLCRIVAKIGRYDTGGQFDGTFAGGIGHSGCFPKGRNPLARPVGTVSDGPNTSAGARTIYQICADYRKYNKNDGALFLSLPPLASICRPYDR